MVHFASRKQRQFRVGKENRQEVYSESDGVRIVVASSKGMVKKILIIEDEQDIRELYAEILRDEGYEIKEVWDGEMGLAEAQSGNYDLILLDIMLPKMDGLQILRELKKSNSVSKSPVVLLTNLGSDAVIKEGFALGAETYIIKSEFTPDQVIAEVKKVLAAPK